jgi:hypothetical protein
MQRDHKRAAFNGLHIGADYSDEEREFLQAVDSFKRLHQKVFLTNAEILAVARSLGYRKVSPAGPLPGVPG